MINRNEFDRIKKLIDKAETKIYNPYAVDEPWEKIVHELTTELRKLLVKLRK